MNSKILTAMVFGAIVLRQSALCQTNSDTNSDVTLQPAVVIAGSNDTAIIAAPLSAGSNDMAVAITSNAPVAASATAGETSPVTNAPASIPLIQFQDVPITTAIENLSRQAGINYLLDPKIGYGQADQNGQIKPEPTLSIRWENITAEQALLALLDNYGLQLVEDRRTGIGRITIKDPAAPPQLVTRVIQLKYAGTSNMVDSVQATLTDKRSRVIADVRTSQMVVVATQPEQDAVDTLIGQLDKPTRQVLIETHLVEVSSNPKTVKGIDWSGTLAAQNISFGNGILDPAKSSTTENIPATGFHTIPGIPGHPLGTVIPNSPSANTTIVTTPQGPGTAGGLALSTAAGLIPPVGFLTADGAHAVLSFLNSSSDAQVISTPRVVTLDNQMATISVTRGFPVINVTASTANTTGGSTIAYTNVGTVLQVTPRISANDYIWLKVVPEVSSFFGTVTKTIGGSVFQADEFDNRRIETQVLIPNANTLVMGGLVKDSPNASYTKVPILGDIPVLGFAFRSENKSLDKDNLIIFITPTIVKDNDFKPATTDFLNSSPHTMKSPMNPHTWWDSSKPRGDWSNPTPSPGEFEDTRKSNIK